MAKLNAEYGSELHLLRYLGRHRHALHKQIEKTVLGRMIDWIDFKFDRQKLDAEWEGLDFLPDYLPVKKNWGRFWPQTGKVQNWDAVGWIEVNSHPELLLVEAKGNAEELISETKAQKHGGLPLIEAAFKKTKEALGVSSDADWLRPYYQYCNRLATLHFLTENGVGARLLFVYFCGDSTTGRNCPKNESEWMASLSTVKKHVGLTGKSELEKRVHQVFIPVVVR